MGTPADLAKDGIPWRVEHYYDLAMGGAAVNGVDKGGIKGITNEMLSESLPEMAEITLTSTPNETATSADITISVNPTSALPENTVLQVLMTDRVCDYKGTYGVEPVNGQTLQYDVVCEFVTDSTGFAVGAKAVGEVVNFAKTITFETQYHVADSLQLIAIVQNYETKEIYAAKKFYNSPFLKTAILNNSGNAQNFFSHSLVQGKLQFTAPFSAKELRVSSLTGKVLQVHTLQNASEGSLHSVSMPVASGVYVYSLVGTMGRVVTKKIMIP